MSDMVRLRKFKGDELYGMPLSKFIDELIELNELNNRGDVIVIPSLEPKAGEVAGYADVRLSIVIYTE